MKKLSDKLSFSVHSKQVSSAVELVSELLLRFFFKFKILMATSLCELPKYEFIKHVF